MSIYKTNPEQWNGYYPGVLDDVYKTCKTSDYKKCCVDSCKRVCPTAIDPATGKGCQNGWRNDICATNLDDDECSDLVKKHFNPPKPANSSRQFAVSTKSQTNIGIGIGIFVFAMIFLLVLYVHSLNR